MGTQPAASADFVSIDEAVCRVAAAIAARDGDEWLGPPTARQLRIIARYIYGSSDSIVPGMITYSVAGQSWAKYPSDPALVAEVERALYQRDLYQEQCEGALDWLESHGFDIDAQDIDGKALAREMAKDFPSKVAAAPRRAADKSPVVPQRVRSAVDAQPGEVEPTTTPKSRGGQSEKSKSVQGALERAGVFPDRKKKTFGQLCDIVIRDLRGYESARERAALKKMIERLYDHLKRDRIA